MIHVETIVEEGWPTVDWPALADRAVAAGLKASPHGWIAEARFRCEVSVKLATDDEVRKLNASYRQQDKPTNVLSFPMVQKDLLGALANSDDGEVLLGDIVLAAGVTAAEAAEKGVPVADHAQHLIVHGLLHLLGMDHEAGNADAEAMEEIETAAMAALGLHDPYPPQGD